MIKIVLKTALLSIVEIVLLCCLYMAFFDYFPFSRPAGTFMIDGDFYQILPTSYIGGTLLLNYIHFKKGAQLRRKLLLYAFAIAIITILIFTVVYAIHTSPSFYFMFTFKMGIYFFCWLLLGAVIQSMGFHLMSKKRA